MAPKAGRPIRVVRVITRLNIGGPAIHAMLLTERLRRPGYESVLLTGRPDASEGDMSDQPSRGQGARRLLIPSLRRALGPWADLRTWWAICSILHRLEPDIVHTHMAKAGALGRTAAMAHNLRQRIRRRPTCQIVHTFHGHVLDGYFSAWVSRLFVIIERWLAHRTDRLIAVSPTVRDTLLRRGIGRAGQWRVIPLGLDLDGLRALGPPNEALPMRVGIVGRLVPIKNPSLFLTALGRVVDGQADSPVSATIVGDGPLRRTLEDEVRRLGLESLVRFTGWQRDLRIVYGGLEATCLTSWNEGTPVALIEAMAAGRPVIATDVGGVRDLLDDAPAAPIASGSFRKTGRGILVRAGDADGLAAALAAVANNGTLRRRLGEAGRTHVLARYGAERLCRDIMTLYDGLAR